MSEVSHDPQEISETQPVFMYQDPLHEEVRQCQDLLDIWRFDSEEAANNLGKQYTTQLNEQAKASRLWQQPVALHGNRLHVWLNTPNVTTGKTTYHQFAVNGEQDSQRVASVAGTFSGFNYLLRDKVTDGNSHSFTVQLAYWITLPGDTSRDPFEAVWAHGDTSHTELVFAADESRAKAADAAKVFMEDTDPEKVQLVASLLPFITAESVSGGDITAAALRIHCYLEASHMKVSNVAKLALLKMMEAKMQLTGDAKIFNINASKAIDRADDNGTYTVAQGVLGKACIRRVVYGPTCSIGSNDWIVNPERLLALYAVMEGFNDTTGQNYSRLVPLSSLTLLTAV